jgi:regulatory protein
VRLLAVRPRGARELARGLAERGFAERAVAGALERLSAAGLLDDVAAARSAVRLRGARYGRARVERELKARGLSKETITAAFEAEGAPAREDEALRRAFERLWKARAHLAPALRRRRVFDALTRRGFPADRISEIIRDWYEVDRG